MRLPKLTSLALLAGVSASPLAHAQETDPHQPGGGGGGDGGGGDSATVTSTAPVATAASSQYHISFDFLTSLNKHTTALRGSDSNVVTTSNGNMYFIDTSAAAADPTNNAITWATNGLDGVSTVNVTALRLWLLETGSTPRGREVYFGPHPRPDPTFATDDWVVTFTSPNATASGTVSLNYRSKSFLAYLGTMYESLIYLSADWISLTDPTRAGRTYTPFFALYVNDSADARSRLESTSAAYGLTTMGEDVIDLSAAISPSADSSNPQSTRGSDSDDGDSTTTSDTTASGSGSDSGLSTGAIVGIAVGAAAVGLLALAALILFCLRRRRRNAAGPRAGKGEAIDHVHDGYESTPANQEFMADKETHPRVAESPHSPYSDNAGAAVAGPSGNRSYTPYSDPPSPVIHPVSPALRSTASPAPSAPSRSASVPRATSATPRGLSRSVAALVEDGMTEDEIRRLEEEERALDADIEEAQRNR